MSQTPKTNARSSQTNAALAAICLVAAILTTGAAPVLHRQLGTSGTSIALSAMWIIAIAEVIIWLRIATPLSLGLKQLSKRDAVLAIGFGLLLTVAVPVLSLGTQLVTGYETGTIDTARQVSASIAIAGVITAAVTEEVIYRAGAMSALLALGTPRILVLLIPAAIFTTVHGSWGVAHTVFVVLPLSIALGALFIWRRNVFLNMIVHLIVDLPVVILAVTGS